MATNYDSPTVAATNLDAAMEEIRATVTTYEEYLGRLKLRLAQVLGDENVGAELSHGKDSPPLPNIYVQTSGIRSRMDSVNARLDSIITRIAL